MSIRDGLEPSHSADSDSHTQRLPSEGSAPARHATTGPDPQPRDPDPQPPDPAWGQPSSPAPGEDPAWPQPTGSATAPPWSQATGRDAQGGQPGAGQGSSWVQTSGPDAQGEQPGAAQGPSWVRATGQERQGDQAQPGWGQGGGGHPTTPAWGSRPADAGSPRGRRPSRALAAAVAAVVLVAGGYGISQALDRDRSGSAAAGAGIPTPAPAAAAPVRPGEEPVAAVAKALLPTVVEIRHGPSGIGSGFVYDRRGYIMTAAHVVEGVDQVDVRLYDGTRLRGEVLGTDEANDVAVIRVDREGLPAAPLAVGQPLQVGQLAIAIGSPFGLAETVTAGIVSSTDRVLPDGREVIQTDAPINPGNSGGMLADRQGRVIGINSSIRPANDGSNGNVGIGFAVPIDLAARSAEAIVRGQPIQTGYLGVTTAPTTGGQGGALVQEVASGSPAERAGLRAGDLVVAIDGQAVQDFSELAARIRAHDPGDRVTLRVVRDGNEITVTATLAQRPAG